MTKEEILETIQNYYQELNADYEENLKAFGFGDPDTKRAYTRLYAVEKLLDRLNIPTND